MSDYKIVEVFWVDSSSVAAWSDPDEMRDCSLECHSIGFMVDETPDRIVISHSVDPEGSAADPMAIPKCAITDLYEVTFANQGRRPRARTPG